MYNRSQHQQVCITFFSLKYIYYNVFCGTENIFWENRKYFLWYYVFSSQMRHLCGSTLYFGLQKCWRWQLFTQNRWGVWLNFWYRFKGYYNCGSENIFCDITYFPHKCATFAVPFVFWFKKCWRWQIFSVILRIFLTNAPPLWFPLYFGLQKCWRWQFLLKIVEEYG